MCVFVDYHYCAADGGKSSFRAPAGTTQYLAEPVSVLA